MRGAVDPVILETWISDRCSVPCAVPSPLCSNYSFRTPARGVPARKVPCAPGAEPAWTAAHGVVSRVRAVPRYGRPVRTRVTIAGSCSPTRRAVTTAFVPPWGNDWPGCTRPRGGPTRGPSSFRFPLVGVGRGRSLRSRRRPWPCPEERGPDVCSRCCATATRPAARWVLDAGNACATGSGRSPSTPRPSVCEVRPWSWSTTCSPPARPSWRRRGCCAERGCVWSVRSCSTRAADGMRTSLYKGFTRGLPKAESPCV